MDVSCKEIELAITELKAFAEKADENQKQEILNRVQYYREGFLLTETDPDLEEIKTRLNIGRMPFKKRDSVVNLPRFIKLSHCCLCKFIARTFLF